MFINKYIFISSWHGQRLKGGTRQYGRSVHPIYETNLSLSIVVKYITYNYNGIQYIDIQ